MIVFVIDYDTRDFYDGIQFHSIWSSKEKAQAFIDKQEDSERPQYEISEYELDSYDKGE